jgi:hypothetical protein
MMDNRAEPHVRSYWRVVAGAVLFVFIASVAAVLVGVYLAWLWTWLEVGWRAMRWALGVA